MFFYLIIATLLIIFIQDIKSRSIWWFLPLLLFVFIIFSKWDELAVKQVFINASFILAILFALMIYLRLRFGEQGKAFFNYFGLGDLLFLLAITPLLDFSNFIYFFTISTIVTLGFHFLINLFRLQKNIPYAGYLSICTGALLLVQKTAIITF